MIIRESAPYGARPITIETGRVARQAGGAAWVQQGGTVVLVTCVGAHTVREGIDFFPLTCDYIEKTFAAGKIPGGFFKREGRQRPEEILLSRLIDRPIRPLFSKGYRNETQVIATLLSLDKENPPDVLAVTGASAALMISDVPWEGPIAAIRVGRVDGAFVGNPTYEEIEKSDLDIIMCASKDAIVMVEGEAAEVSESVLVDAIFFGLEAVQPVLALQERIRAAVGKPKRPVVAPVKDETLAGIVRADASGPLDDALAIPEKQARYAALDTLSEKVVAAIAQRPGFEERQKEIKAAFDEVKKDKVRRMVLDTARRIDGRRPDEIRTITCEVGILPRTHGSALFTRGETQAIVATTLGTREDEQKIDALTGQWWKTFMLHYNFPPFSTGEVKMLRGASRREIGHGNLAERAVSRMIPKAPDFPYTVRIVSEILESNGSSSMASVCGATLSLMDAGVPIASPVAGIAMGLVTDGRKHQVLTDILGDEDHLGDMDFKVCGSRNGITAVQMDIKISGLTREILAEALDRANQARQFVLGRMLETLPTHRPELSALAPRIVTVHIPVDKIRDVIGPGGKVIRGIVDQTGCSINVEDDGSVRVASADGEALKKALDIIEGLTRSAQVGEVYTGTVKRCVDFGAFIEILPNVEGLLHISEMDWRRVGTVDEICKEGDSMEVKVVNVDPMGKVRLSRKELLPKPEGYVERPPSERRPPREGGREGRGGRGGGRGGGGRRG
ncbi:MAG: polyribonucleotide nucleotidyltransferase [Deltaproteobacteria bacterium]|nr:polyribonucleotide nucleotidyltransferase [Deltaproteobacteria bacterium]